MLVTKIKSIRITFFIAAFYDYEICQMHVKTVFLNWKLIWDVYMTLLKGFDHSKYPNKVYNLDKSIYRLKQAASS